MVKERSRVKTAVYSIMKGGMFLIIPLNDIEIKEYLDNAITKWRKQKKDSEDAMKNILNTEWSGMSGQCKEEILVASCYIDAFQSVRVSLFGELLPLWKLEL